MALYVAAHLSSLEFSINAGSSYVSVNLFDASKVKIDVSPTKQAIQSGKSVTAKKKAAVEVTLFDFDSAVNGVLKTAENAFTEARWKLTLKTGNTIVTKDAPISISQSNAQSDGLLGYVVSSEYEVPVGTDATTNTFA